MYVNGKPICSTQVGNHFQNINWQNFGSAMTLKQTKSPHIEKIHCDEMGENGKAEQFCPSLAIFGRIKLTTHAGHIHDPPP